MSERVHVWHVASSGFEAARSLPGLAAGHRLGRLHGHHFEAQLRAELPAGWAPFAGAEVSHLRELVQAQTQAWDYRHLNESQALPSDLGLAQALGQQLKDLPGQRQLSLRSTAGTGVDLRSDGRPQVWRRYAFQSAHQLPQVPPGHKCGRLHGHGFEVILHAELAEGASDVALGDTLDALWTPWARQLDHAYLNDLPGLDNPTSEILSSWLFERLKVQCPVLCGVTVFETGSSASHFDGQHYRIWKEFTLDSAVQLRQAPEGSPLRRVHGHTYTLRLHLSAPLDQVQGWVVDFGDVKELFSPLFKSLDHHPLHLMPELGEADGASVAQWTLRRAREVLPQLDRVDLYETPGCGVVVALDPAALRLSL